METGKIYIRDCDMSIDLRPSRYHDIKTMTFIYVQPYKVRDYCDDSMSCADETLVSWRIQQYDISIYRKFCIFNKYTHGIFIFHKAVYIM